MKDRIYFLDNLRTFLIFLVVLLHSGIVYERVLESNWLVIDTVKNDSIGLIRMYLDVFVMFIMFYISGYFIPVSLKRNDSWGYIKSKFNRILLPWLVAVFTLIPAYKVIFLFSRGLPQEEWYSYFHLFQRPTYDLSYFADNPSQSWLWFLPVLFMFQLVYLAFSKLNLLSFNISMKKAVIAFFAIGLIYSMAISLSGLSGWVLTPILDFQRERLLVYFMVFLLGSLSYKLKVFDSDVKNRQNYIIANVVLTLALTMFTIVALNLFFNLIDPGRNYYFVSETIDRIGYYGSLLLSMLSFLYIFLHVFRFNFNKPNLIMKELNKNSYQVYIIHIVVMGIIALGLLYVPIPAFIKFLILTILTYLFSNFIVSAYHYLFKNNNYFKVAALVIMVVALFTLIGVGNKNNSAIAKGISRINQPSDPAQTIGIHEAVVTGNIEAVEEYISNGSDLNLKDPAGGSSPLITAAVFGKTEIASALIEAGADLNVTNNDGSTAMHTAAFFCRTEIVEALLKNGADKSVKNKSGSTALESVTAPYEMVKGIYEYFRGTLAPLGFQLDEDFILETRPVIAEMLSE